MKKLLAGILIISFTACNSDQGGTVNDGINAIDTDGALQDTGIKYTPDIDTAIGEHRVDIQPRNDTTKIR